MVERIELEDPITKPITVPYQSNYLFRPGYVFGWLVRGTRLWRHPAELGPRHNCLNYGKLLAGITR